MIEGWLLIVYVIGSSNPAHQNAYPTGRYSTEKVCEEVAQTQLDSALWAVNLNERYNAEVYYECKPVKGMTAQSWRNSLPNKKHELMVDEIKRRREVREKAGNQ